MKRLALYLAAALITAASTHALAEETKGADDNVTKKVVKGAVEAVKKGRKANPVGVFFTSSEISTKQDLTPEQAFVEKTGRQQVKDHAEMEKARAAPADAQPSRQDRHDRLDLGNDRDDFGGKESAIDTDRADRLSRTG